ncbi:MAG: protein kinase, partial [Bradymonadaceae bacterium]
MPRQCPRCESVYGESTDTCPRDGATLETIDPDDDPLVGQVIDERFRLEQLLGAGGMGRVYRGVQLSIDRDVAIKLLRDEAVPDRSRKERFIREARVISGFKHPNIVRLIDFGTDPDRNFP